MSKNMVCHHQSLVPPVITTASHPSVLTGKGGGMRQNVAWLLEFLVIFRGQTHWPVFLSQSFTKKQPAHIET